MKKNKTEIKTPGKKVGNNYWLIEVPSFAYNIESHPRMERIGHQEYPLGGEVTDFESFGCFNSQLLALRAAYSVGECTNQPTIQIKQGKIPRPFTPKECMIARIEDFEVNVPRKNNPKRRLTHKPKKIPGAPPNIVAFAEEFADIWPMWNINGKFYDFSSKVKTDPFKNANSLGSQLYTCSGIASKPRTDRFKLIPFYLADKDIYSGTLERKLKGRQYEALEGPEFRLKEVKGIVQYNDSFEEDRRSLSKEGVLQNPLWIALAGGDKSLLKQYADLAFTQSSLKEYKKGLSFGFCFRDDYNDKRLSNPCENYINFRTGKFNYSIIRPLLLGSFFAQKGISGCQLLHNTHKENLVMLMKIK